MREHTRPICPSQTGSVPAPQLSSAAHVFLRTTEPDPSLQLKEKFH